MLLDAAAVLASPPSAPSEAAPSSLAGASPGVLEKSGERVVCLAAGRPRRPASECPLAAPEDPVSGRGTLAVIGNAKLPTCGN